jgi:hypothetical protein
VGRQFPDGFEELGSSSEVDRFRVQIRYRLLVEREHLVVAPHLLDQERVGSPVRGTHPNENALRRPQFIEVVRPVGTGIDLHRERLRLSPRQHLHGGNQLGGDAIRNQVGEALFFRQHVGDASDLPGSVVYANHDDAAGRVGEGHDGFENAFRGGKIALEFQRLTFVAAEDGR